MIKTINSNSYAEITVKKSKFIAHVFYVETENEAQTKLKQIQKEYNDAKHNCYAYIIQEINGNTINSIQKSSDNGEPSGTAGAPLMDLLLKQGLSNILVVVTRYFGGVLLGTGGLVKAYTESAVQAIEKTEIVEKEIGNQYEVILKYDELSDFNYQCNKIDIKIVEIKYEEMIKVIIETTSNKFERLNITINKELEYKIKKEKIWI